jgi:large subunit ribosomal protein LP0
MAEVPVENKKWVRKTAYWGKLHAALDEYKNVLIIGVDFVGSNQMQQVRKALRGKGIVLMGKNTIIRKVLRERAEKGETSLESLIPYIYGNIGFVFTNGDLNALRQIVTSNKVPASAKTGVVAPIDVVIPPGPTGLDPGQTSFFQTMNIGTKIVKGSIEMTTSSKVCTKGEKISASAVALLAKLNIRPFQYGITVDTVYENGSAYSVKVLDMTDNDLVNMFANSCASLAAISFALGYVNQVTIPHSFGRAFKMICSLALATDYNFDELKVVKEMIANPQAFAPAAAPAGGGGKAPAAAAKPVEKAPEPEPEEEAAPAVDLFGGGGKKGGGGDY